MFGIYYNQFTEGSSKVFWLTPDNEGSNSNQYVVAFSRGENEAQKNDVLCIVGDLEYQAVLECFEQASDIMINKDIGYQRTIRSKNLPDTVSMSFLRKTDTDKVRIRLDFYDQEPFEAGAFWKGKSPSTFAFYRNLDELPELGRLLKGGGDEATDPAFYSNQEDWFVRRNLFPDVFGDKPIIPFQRFKEDVISDVKAHAPESFAEIWVQTLNRLNPKTNIANCKECKQPFYQEARWKKVCYQCYTGFRSGRVFESQIEKFQGWLFDSKY